MFRNSRIGDHDREPQLRHQHPGNLAGKRFYDRGSWVYTGKIKIQKVVYLNPTFNVSNHTKYVLQLPSN